MRRQHMAAGPARCFEHRDVMSALHQFMSAAKPGNAPASHDHFFGASGRGEGHGGSQCNRERRASQFQRIPAVQAAGGLLKNRMRSVHGESVWRETAEAFSIIVENGLSV